MRARAAAGDLALSGGTAVGGAGIAVLAVGVRRALDGRRATAQRIARLIGRTARCIQLVRADAVRAAVVGAANRVGALRARAAARTRPAAALLAGAALWRMAAAPVGAASVDRARIGVRALAVVTALAAARPAAANLPGRTEVVLAKPVFALVRSASIGVVAGSRRAAAFALPAADLRHAVLAARALGVVRDGHAFARKTALRSALEVVAAVGVRATLCAVAVTAA